MTFISPSQASAASVAITAPKETSATSSPTPSSLTWTTLVSSRRTSRPCRMKSGNVDDPLTVNYNGNNTPCGILEVGDPLENEPNYGDYAYTLNNFTYHLQDLVFLPYFGAPRTTSVNSWFTFQDENVSVCSNGS